MLLTPAQREKQDATQHAAMAKNAEEKAFVEHFLRTSSSVAARVGSITALSSTSSLVEEMDGQFRKGKYSCKVTGTARSEPLAVYWERVLPSAQLRVIKVEDSAGQIIQP